MDGDDAISPRKPTAPPPIITINQIDEHGECIPTSPRLGRQRRRSSISRRIIQAPTPTHETAPGPSLGNHDNNDPTNQDFTSLWYRLIPSQARKEREEISEFSTFALDWTEWIVPDDDAHLGGGSFGEVYKGKWINVPEYLIPLPKVAIKVIKTLPLHYENGEKKFKQLKREVIVWRSLNHPNIVPFVGVSVARGKYPSLISVWMENGSIKEYIKVHPNVNKMQLIHGVACGLEYLHYNKPEIVHGDLKAENVLVNNRGVPCLVDFGLSRMMEDPQLQLLWATSATSAPGTTRWKSPELLSGEQATVTVAGDIYAFAMTCMELITEQVPFPQYHNDYQILCAVMLRKERPIRPTHVAITDAIWKLWMACWSSSPKDRPLMKKILEVLNSNKEFVSDSSPNRSAANLISPPPTPPLTNVAGKRSPGWDRIEGHDWTAEFQLNKNVVFLKSQGSVQHDSEICCVCFSSGGKYVATGSNRKTYIFATLTCETIREFEDDSLPYPLPNYIRSIRFSPDGRYIATGNDKAEIKLWDIGKQAVHTVYRGHEGPICALDYSRDGTLLVSGSNDQTIRIWDSSGAVSVIRIIVTDILATTGASVISVAFSPNRRLVAAGCTDSVIRIWNVQSGELTERLNGHQDEVCSVSFTPEGQGIFSGSSDGTLKHWDLSPFMHRNTQHLNIPLGVMVPPQSHQLCEESGERGSVHIRELNGHDGCVESVSVSRDGKWIVSGSTDRSVQVWDAKTGQILLKLQGHKGSVQSVAFGPSDTLRVIASGGKDGKLRLWRFWDPLTPVGVPSDQAKHAM